MLSRVRFLHEHYFSESMTTRHPKHRLVDIRQSSAEGLASILSRPAKGPVKSSQAIVGFKQIVDISSIFGPGQPSQHDAVKARKLRASYAQATRRTKSPRLTSRSPERRRATGEVSNAAGFSGGVAKAVFGLDPGHCVKNRGRASSRKLRASSAHGSAQPP